MTEDDTPWVVTHLIAGGRIPGNPVEDWLRTSCAVLRRLDDRARQTLRDRHLLSEIELEILDGLLPGWNFGAGEAGFAELLDTTRALARP